MFFLLPVHLLGLITNYIPYKIPVWIVENKIKVSESSGIFFNQQNIEALQQAINSFNKIEKKFNPFWIRKHAENFQESSFLQSFTETIDKLIQK